MDKEQLTQALGVQRQRIVFRNVVEHRLEPFHQIAAFPRTLVFPSRRACIFNCDGRDQAACAALVARKLRVALRDHLCSER